MCCTLSLCTCTGQPTVPPLPTSAATSISSTSQRSHHTSCHCDRFEQVRTSVPQSNAPTTSRSSHRTTSSLHMLNFAHLFPAIVTLTLVVALGAPAILAQHASPLQYAAPEECEWHSLTMPTFSALSSSSASSSSSSTSSSTSAALRPGGSFSYVQPLLFDRSSLPVGAVAVACRLRCINCASNPPTNFTLIQSARTTSLHVQCDDLLALSALANNSFAHLQHLRQLQLHSCKLPQLPNDAFSGLTGLTHLSIRTHNADWQLQLHLPSASLFRHMPALEQVDLSSNALTRLPSNLFCEHSARLDFLNLSSNAFTDLFAVGFSSKQPETATGSSCVLTSLKSLDLSGNRLKVLSDNALSRLTGLTSLDLSGNQLSRAEESSLSGLHELRVLRMSGNQLVALPPRFFRSVAERLSELYLHNNSISVLPPGLFHSMRALRSLDLSHNEITSHWINAKTFEHLRSLATLDLSHNRLSRLDAATFAFQSALSVLKLSHNELDSVSPSVFKSLSSLQQLVLSHNRLLQLPSEVFSSLAQLRSLSLDGNQLSVLSTNLFHNLTELMELNCSQNAFADVPEPVRSLGQLRALDLSHNRLARLRNASLRGLEQLYSLSLESNSIGNLSRGALSDLPALRVLNLASNRISHIAAGTFEDVPDLHFLRLDSNQLTDVNGLFSHLRDLLMLNVSRNRIDWFDYALIPMGLQLLDLHSNRVATLANYYHLENVLKLRTLDASFNRITELSASSLPNGIELLHLQGNQLRSLAASTFLGKHNLTKVDLTDNQLRQLPLNALQLSTGKLRRAAPELRLAGNPLVCDCQMDWLQRAAQLHDSRQYPRVADANALKCQPAFSNHSVPVAHVPADSFLCSYRTHCFALCHCCEFDACDCKMTCPDSCECYYDAGWTVNVVSCSGPRQPPSLNDASPFNSENRLGLNVGSDFESDSLDTQFENTALSTRPLHRKLPARIPMDATELRLDGNDLPSLSAHAFIGRKSMRVLWLNASNVLQIDNRTFNGLRSLQVLLLQNNHLQTLQGFEFEWLADLQHLDLSYNRLVSIANHTFAALRSLRVLNLAGNRLTAFPLPTLQVNQQLQSLSLANNRWTCECEFTAAAVPFLRALGSRLQDAARVRCHVTNSLAPLLLTEFRQSMCITAAPSSVGRASASAGTSSRPTITGFQRLPTFGYLPLAAALAAGSLLLATLAMLIALLVYRRECGIWFQSKYGLRWSGSGALSTLAPTTTLPNGQTGTMVGTLTSTAGFGQFRREEERLFDAYLSYSKKDESFVGQMLAPELEYGSPPFRLCLHYRDLPVASGYLSEAIAEAMQASRRTILLISDSYLKSEWCRYEFKNAHLEVLRSNRQKLILIFLGSISLKELQGKKFEWVIYTD